MDLQGGAKMKKLILHNLGLKIVTLFVAFIFWQLVIGLADPVVTETFRDIPVTMLNEELVTNKGRVYQVVDNNKKITVTIKGKTSIVRSITSDMLEATANFEEIELASLVPVRVSVRGISGNMVESMAMPNNIIVNIEDSASKKFPITPVAIGDVGEGKVLGSISADTETITISGPASIIDTITKVEARINVTDLADDASINSELIYFDESSLTIDQTLLSNELSDPVKVNVEILNSKSVSLKFDELSEITTGYEVVSITSEPSAVVVYGSDEKLDSLDVIQISGADINVKGKTGKVDKVLDINDYLPEGIYLFDKDAASIAATIQIDELGTKSLEVPVQSIVVHNNPEELNLEYNAVTDIMLTFTGKDSILSDLSVDDVRLSIDLTTYNKQGEFDVEVNVISVEGCQLIEDVTVPIKLTKKLKN